MTDGFALCELGDMTLTDYLEENGRGTLTTLAKTVGTSKGYLADIVEGRRVPSVAFAKRIEAATKGQVTAISLLGLDRRKTKGVKA